MNVLLFGATGMIGQGTLRACLADPDVTRVVSLVRSPSGETHSKLTEVLHRDFTDYTSVISHFTHLDACLFCLGVSSVGLSEAEYSSITYDYTLAAARVVIAQSPDATFVYISGALTDGTEKGSTMWARVKGRTENALLQMPFKRAHMMRPGFILPKDGIVAKTKLYRVGYSVVGWAYPLIKALAPNQVMTTTELGKAMVHVARNGAPKKVLEASDIVAIVRA
jgi:uncharacterized protein YbjT (DUF2867 family)